MEPKGLLAC